MAAHWASIIEQRRKYLRMTYEQLAELADVPEATVKRMVIPGANPGIYTVERVLNALGLDLEVVDAAIDNVANLNIVQAVADDYG